MTFQDGANAAQSDDDYPIEDMNPSYHHDEWNDDSWVEETYDELMAYAATKKKEEEDIDGVAPGGFSEEDAERIQHSIDSLLATLNTEKERIDIEYKAAQKVAKKDPGKALRMVHGLSRDIENLMMRLTDETNPLSSVSDDDQIELLFNELMKVKKLEEDVKVQFSSKREVALRPAAKKKTPSKKSAKKKK